MRTPNLFYEFIENDKRQMTFGALPVQPKEQQLPIMPTERWRDVNGALHKTYKFRRQEDRNQFVISLLSYEQSVQHNAEFTITEQQVTIKVQTKNVDRVTELDKEYARYADVLFRDLVYSPSYEP